MLTGPAGRFLHSKYMQRQSRVKFASNSRQIRVKFASNSRQIRVKFASNSRQIRIKFASNSRQIHVKVASNSRQSRIKFASKHARFPSRFAVSCFVFAGWQKKLSGASAPETEPYKTTRVFDSDHFRRSTGSRYGVALRPCGVSVHATNHVVESRRSTIDPWGHSPGAPVHVRRKKTQQQLSCYTLLILAHP